MSFSTNTPEFSYQYLHRQRIQEAEKARLVRQVMETKHAMYTGCGNASNQLRERVRELICRRRQPSSQQPEASLGG